MSENDIPFYVQGTILDRYIHSSDPRADPIAIKVIVEGLRSRSDLRRYFFRSAPDAAWASILWENGFFREPPEPVRGEGGFLRLLRWDEQEYLLSIAAQVPDIVVQHLAYVSAQSGYVAPALRALRAIPVDRIRAAAPTILRWLSEDWVSPFVALEMRELLRKLAQGGDTTTTLDLFCELTEPVRSPAAERGEDAWLVKAAVSKMRDPGEKEVLFEGVALLGSAKAPELVAVLEQHLVSALRLEAEAMDDEAFECESWWLSSVAGAPKRGGEYRDALLSALRDVLLCWVEQEPEAVRSVLSRYLTDPHGVLRRLGLFVLSRHVDDYPSLVAVELTKVENLDDSATYPEFFPLLRRGYTQLAPAEKECLIGAILQGPPPSRLEKYRKDAAWLGEGRDPDAYAATQKQYWIRDRLAFIREHLSEPTRRVLDDLVTELGEAPPLIPAERQEMGFERVVEKSPLSEQQLAEMEPEELLQSVGKWQPEADERFWPERFSRKALAEAVANVVFRALDRYGQYLVELALSRPELATAFLEQLKTTVGDATPWRAALDLCQALLGDNRVLTGTDAERGGSWVDARSRIVDLLQSGLAQSPPLMPSHELLRVRDLLLILINDPDPPPEYDRPPEGTFGHNDPATVAINHVRPKALAALMRYAWLHAIAVCDHTSETADGECEPCRVEPVVKQALTRKLDPEQEPSWAVRSVYGHYLPLLYWLDQAWLDSHIDDVFPEGKDEKDRWLFVAAWDSYVIFNRFRQELLDLLRQKYERAIGNLGQGYVSETHLQPARSLGVHVTWEYLLAGYGLSSPAGSESLIVQFFEQAPSEQWGTPAWVIQSAGQRKDPEFPEYWPRARALWEWRAREASQAGHPVDFDDEMQWFAELLLVVPPSESISTLWPLLEGLLPHITRSEEWNPAWNAVEKYLAQVVDEDSLAAIQFYRLMHDRLSGPRWNYPDEGRKIIEVAAAHPESREEALGLIDLLGRRGDYRFKEIYDRYAG